VVVKIMPSKPGVFVGTRSDTDTDQVAPFFPCLHKDLARGVCADVWRLCWDDGLMTLTS
jgi:hypothetical protein